MRFAGIVATVYIFLTVALAATYNITVGNNGNFTYEPAYLSDVKTGDIVNFLFVSSIAHTVSESTFDKPCSGKPSGKSSGVKTAPNTFSITIDNVSAPWWFYCNIGSHCSKYGMVFGINPTKDQSYDAFKANAANHPLGSSTAASPSASSKSGEMKVSIHKLTVTLAGMAFFIGLTL